MKYKGRLSSRQESFLLWDFRSNGGCGARYGPGIDQKKSIDTVPVVTRGTVFCSDSSMGERSASFGAGARWPWGYLAAFALGARGAASASISSGG